MFAGTHICLPLIIAGISDWNRVRRHREPRFTRAQLYVVALGGILPDLLSLHVSLEARHNSPVHTLWFPLALLPLFLVLALPGFRRYLHVAFMAWIGVLLHLFGDLISGGIPFWGVNNGIVGRYYVPPVFWWPLDVVMILTAWYVFFRTRFLLSGGTMRSPTCSWEEKILEEWRTREGIQLPAEPPEKKDQ